MMKLLMIVPPLLLLGMACYGGHSTPPVVISQEMSEGPGDEMPTWYSGDGFEELRLSGLAQ
jgi:hypothetical protein